MKDYTFKMMIVSDHGLEKLGVVKRIQDIVEKVGIDALIRAWEVYTSLGASPFSDAMAERAMEFLEK